HDVRPGVLGRDLAGVSVGYRDALEPGQRVSSKHRLWRTVFAPLSPLGVPIYENARSSENGRVDNVAGVGTGRIDRHPVVSHGHAGVPRRVRVKPRAGIGSV